MSGEELNYLRIHELSKRVDAMEVRQTTVERFLQSKFPGEIAPEFEGDAGELGTAPDLKPVVLNTGEPISTVEYNRNLNLAMELQNGSAQ